MTRGRVCNLLPQVILGIVNAVTLGSKSRRIRDHMFLSHLRLDSLSVYGVSILTRLHTGGGDSEDRVSSGI
jgi:hypothetical protein